jgi:N-acetylmuramoyl-L-alanine amidase
MNEQDIDILARTIYGEARGEYSCLDGGMASLMAVANVIMNRLKRPLLYGKTISEVCQKPRQFSCWNAHDPNRVLIMQKHITDPLFPICSHVAVKVANSDWPDITKGSDHYHVTYLHPKPPWVRRCIPRVRLARHIFYQMMQGG